MQFLSDVSNLWCCHPSIVLSPCTVPQSIMHPSHHSNTSYVACPGFEQGWSLVAHHSSSRCTGHCWLPRPERPSTSGKVYQTDCCARVGQTRQDVSAALDRRIKMLNSRYADASRCLFCFVLSIFMFFFLSLFLF